MSIVSITAQALTEAARLAADAAEASDRAMQAHLQAARAWRALVDSAHLADTAPPSLSPVVVAFHAAVAWTGCDWAMSLCGIDCQGMTAVGAYRRAEEYLDMQDVDNFQRWSAVNSWLNGVERCAALAYLRGTSAMRMWRAGHLQEAVAAAAGATQAEQPFLREGCPRRWGLVADLLKAERDSAEATTTEGGRR